MHVTNDRVTVLFIVQGGLHVLHLREMKLTVNIYNAAAKYHSFSLTTASRHTDIVMTT